MWGSGSAKAKGKILTRWSLSPIRPRGPGRNARSLGACKCYSLGSSEVLNMVAIGSKSGETKTASGEEIIESETGKIDRRKTKQKTEISRVHQKRTVRWKYNEDCDFQ